MGKESTNISTVSMSQTAGLTSISQMVDKSANELFSFKDSTSGTENILMTFSPSFEEQGSQEVAIEERE